MTFNSTFSKERLEKQNITYRKKFPKLIRCFCTWEQDESDSLLYDYYTLKLSLEALANKHQRSEQAILAQLTLLKGSKMSYNSRKSIPKTYIISSYDNITCNYNFNSNPQKHSSAHLALEEAKRLMTSTLEKNPNSNLEFHVFELKNIVKPLRNIPIEVL